MWLSQPQFIFFVFLWFPFCLKQWKGLILCSNLNRITCQKSSAKISERGLILSCPNQNIFKKKVNQEATIYTTGTSILLPFVITIFSQNYLQLSFTFFDKRFWMVKYATEDSKFLNLYDSILHHCIEYILFG